MLLFQLQPTNLKSQQKTYNLILGMKYLYFKVQIILKPTGFEGCNKRKLAMLTTHVYTCLQLQFVCCINLNLIMNTVYSFSFTVYIGYLAQYGLCWSCNINALMEIQATTRGLNRSIQNPLGQMQPCVFILCQRFKGTI